MNYVLAFFLPPLALVLTERIGHAILNLIICIIAILLAILSLGNGIPVTVFLLSVAVLHAWFVIHGARSDRRTDEKLAKLWK